jgi:hypothetical protein
MNDWNQLLHQSIEEFKNQRTVTIKARHKKTARMLFGKIAIGFAFQAVLFFLWLVTGKQSSLMTISMLIGLVYDLWLLGEASS